MNITETLLWYRQLDGQHLQAVLEEDPSQFSRACLVAFDDQEEDKVDLVKYILGHVSTWSDITKLDKSVLLKTLQYIPDYVETCTSKIIRHSYNSNLHLVNLSAFASETKVLSGLRSFLASRASGLIDSTAVHRSWLRILHKYYEFVTKNEDIFTQCEGTVLVVYKELHRVIEQMHEIVIQQLQNWAFFRCHTVNELENFIAVISLLNSIGQIAIYIDIVCMADIWKCFLKLCMENAVAVRTYPAQDSEWLLNPIKFLFTEIENGIGVMSREFTRSVENFKKVVKINIFFMALVQQIVLDYGIQYDVYEVIIERFFYFKRLKWKHSMHADLQMLIHNQFTSKLTVMVQVICKNAGFILDYILKDAATDHSDAINRLEIITISLKEVVKNNQEQLFDQYLLSKKQNVIAKITELIGEGYLHLNDFDYDDMCITAAAFALVNVSNCRRFEIIEHAMVDSLQSNNFWIGSFSVDLWKIVVRYAPMPMRKHYLDFWTSVYAYLTNKDPQNSYDFVKTLIPILFDLNSSESKGAYLNKIMNNRHIPVILGANRVVDVNHNVFTRKYLQPLAEYNAKQFLQNTNAVYFVKMENCLKMVDTDDTLLNKMHAFKLIDLLEHLVKHSLHNSLDKFKWSLIALCMDVIWKNYTLFSMRMVNILDILSNCCGEKKPATIQYQIVQICTLYLCSRTANIQSLNQALPIVLDVLETADFVLRQYCILCLGVVGKRVEFRATIVQRLAKKNDNYHRDIEVYFKTKSLENKSTIDELKTMYTNHLNSNRQIRNKCPVFNLSTHQDLEIDRLLASIKENTSKLNAIHKVKPIHREKEVILSEIHALLGELQTDPQ